MTDRSGRETSLLQRLWEREQCVPVSGIHEPSDLISCLDFKRVSDEEVRSFVANQMSANEIYSKDPSNLADLFIGEGVAGPRRMRVAAGETSAGSEGFVAVSIERDLLWLAFFDFSNPFEPASIRILNEDSFAVMTNHRADWIFRFDEPTNITARKGDFGWPRWPFWSQQ